MDIDLAYDTRRGEILAFNKNKSIFKLAMERFKNAVNNVS